MKEDLFFNVGIDTSCLEEKKEKWQIRLFRKITKHKFIFLMLAIVFICLLVNFWLIYSFMSILGA